MTIQIPDPPAEPSKYWAALERTSPIVQVDGGIATTTSMRVANGTGIQHKNVLEMVRNNIADFEEFERVAFETRPFDTAGGVQNRVVAILTEDHATLLMTYLRNNDVVKDFKKRLVHAFAELRRGASPTIPQTYAEALRAAADQSDRADRAEALAEQRAVPAAAWNELAEAAGDYSVADAAKVLSRDNQVATGERRLFASMRHFGWIYREGGRWRAYQGRIEDGRLAEKVGKPYVRNGEMCVGDPTVRVTPKGLATLHKLLGGSGQLALMAVSE